MVAFCSTFGPDFAFVALLVLQIIALFEVASEATKKFRSAKSLVRGFVVACVFSAAECAFL